MFENDVTITGKHATFLKYLVKDAGLFERYIDVYMNAAVWGVLHERRAKPDSSDDRARIYADAFANERDNCVFLYRMVMLLDKSVDIPAVERVDRAFRYDTQENRQEEFRQNMNLFHDYVRGGVEVMYEQLTDGCTTQEDYLVRAYEVMTTFKQEIEGFSYEEELRKLIK